METLAKQHYKVLDLRTRFTHGLETSIKFVGKKTKQPVVSVQHTFQASQMSTTCLNYAKYQNTNHIQTQSHTHIHTPSKKTYVQHNKIKTTAKDSKNKQIT